MSVDYAGASDGHTAKRYRRGVADTGDARIPVLSPREKEVLIAWLRHESKAAAGRDIYVTRATVATHIQRIRTKYDAVGRPASTKVGLLIRLLEDGVLDIADI